MICAMLKGELPPRALEGVDERSSTPRPPVTRDRRLGKGDGSCRLRAGEVELDDADEPFARYGVKEHALLYAEVT